MKEIVINTTSHNYSILIENGLSNSIHSFLASNNYIIITDENVYNLYRDVMVNITNFIIIIKPGEVNKSIETIQFIYEELIRLNVTRDDVLIAFGGGVVGDLCGFVAATYMRGLEYIQVPTTLLSQVDSSVGGKTGFNYSGYKNIIGAFKQPKKVFIDPSLLKTLSVREFNNGIAEVIKAGLIKDSSILTLLKGNYEDELENIIYKSIEVKKYFVENDEYDKGIRNILNFGHTIGHALETITKHSLLHGEAISIGMYTIFKNQVLRDLCIKFELPYELPVSLLELKEVMLLDKKRKDNKLNTIWCKDVGEPIILQMSVDDFINRVGVMNEKN